MIAGPFACDRKQNLPGVHLLQILCDFPQIVKDEIEDNVDYYFQ